MRLSDHSHPSRVVHCHEKRDQVANATGGGFRPEADICSLKDANALRPFSNHSASCFAAL